ncbi:MAG: PEP/pyruvate-binding domain-containing protein [bacterium]|nr:PEP/pyruvate-binding domain-containing protein [bacterium]
MDFIRTFKEINKNDVASVGGKGASLGEMTQAGTPVPPGFVILTSAFERFLAESDLNQELDTILDHEVNREELRTVDIASERIQQLILSARMPADIAREIKSAFKKLGAKYVAVRSSATAEDSTSTAWAGQLDTFLNTTEENLLENVQKCWASLFTPRAIFYRFEKGMHGQKISVAVVIQKMIQSEVSGIAFSVHPVTEDRNQLIIEAGFGLGEAIVSGQVTPDSYVVEKNPRRIIDKNITVQPRSLVRAGSNSKANYMLIRANKHIVGEKINDGPPSRKASAGEPNEWRELSEKEGQKPTLRDEQVFELTDLVLKLESHYGFPVDVEWAYEQGEFYIMQSRPITTLSPLR